MTPVYFRWICIYITEWKLQLKQNKTQKTNKTKDLDNHKNNGTWLGLNPLYEAHQSVTTRFVRIYIALCHII